MLLLCPNCVARYLTPDDQIGPNGRRVRCARCAHVWFVELKLSAKKSGEPELRTAGTQNRDSAVKRPQPQQPSSSDNVVKIEPLPPSRVPAIRTTKVRKNRFLGWFVSAAIVVAFIINLAPVREQLDFVWPAVDKVVHAFETLTATEKHKNIDLPLEVDLFANEWIKTESGTQLLVRGVIVNRSEVEQPAQFIRIRLYDALDQKIRDRRDEVTGGIFSPWERRPFYMIFENPGDVVRALPTLGTAE
jgi:predicted Zn finger-like uncharacterized protein